MVNSPDNSPRYSAGIVTEQHAFPETPEYLAACEAVVRIQRFGIDARLVGGCVRDLLLGRTPGDYDIVYAASPEDLRQVFPDAVLVGACFGVSLIRSGGFEFECAAARLERNYQDGRHPEQVKYSFAVLPDLERRDFTVNALCYDPVSRLVTDCFGGLDDLRRGVIRTVGDPEERFREDYLRMLRAVRFASRLDFTLAGETASAVRRLAPLCRRLAAERVRGELSLMLTGRHPDRAFRLLESTGLLAEALPEIAALRGVEQPPDFHPEGDVLEHTLLMLSRMVYPSQELAWSVLLHDVGKRDAVFTDASGRTRFYNHEVIGADIADKILFRLRFPNDSRAAVVQAVRNHMRFASVKSMRRAKVRKLLADANFPLELELHRLDCRSCHGLMEIFVYLLDLLAAEPAARDLPPPWVMGRDLVAAGIPPSARFGAVLTECYDRQLAGDFSDSAAALSWAKATLRNSN